MKTKNMRWSENVTLEFVKLYLKHECLWNPAHPGYKLKNQRERAYNLIISEFRDYTEKNLSITEVKMKVKNLRTTYLQEVDKILERSSPDLLYEPSLIWFQDMDQCLKHIPRSRHSTYSNAQESPEGDCSEVWLEVKNDDDDNEELENPDPLIPQTDDEHDFQQESYVKTERMSSPYVKHITKSKKKRMKRKYLRKYSSGSSSEFTLKEDEFDHYGKFIAVQLRNMDLHKALRLQLEIQNIVNEARISTLK